MQIAKLPHHVYEDPSITMVIYRPMQTRLSILCLNTLPRVFQIPYKIPLRGVSNADEKYIYAEVDKIKLKLILLMSGEDT